MRAAKGGQAQKGNFTLIWPPLQSRETDSSPPKTQIRSSVELVFLGNLGW